MVIGLCMLPGAFIVGFLLCVIFASQELGALAIGGAIGIIVLRALMSTSYHPA